jgi:hypothetical protein
MKRYYFLMVVFFAFVIAVGVSSRRNQSSHSASIAMEPTLETRDSPGYKWGEIEIEPFLYAVPLGSFTPYDDLSVLELPNARAAIVGVLIGGEATGYTSEYTFDGELWLCVDWNVDEEAMSWECKGWVPAKMGTVDRDWEYSPEVDDIRNDA